MNFGSVRIIELSCKIWVLASKRNFVSHFRRHLGPADSVKVMELLVSDFIFGMFLLLFPLSQIFHLFLSGQI